MKSIVGRDIIKDDEKKKWGNSRCGLARKKFFLGKNDTGGNENEAWKVRKAKEKVGRELLTWIEDDSLVVCDGETWKC